jgi:hypothetical protein
MHGSNARNLSVQLPLSQLAKTLFFLIIAYVFSSTELEKRAEQALPGSEGSGGKGWGTGRRNSPK